MPFPHFGVWAGTWLIEWKVNRYDTYVQLSIAHMSCSCSWDLFLFLFLAMPLFCLFALLFHEIQKVLQLNLTLRRFQLRFHFLITKRVEKDFYKERPKFLYGLSHAAHHLLQRKITHPHHLKGKYKYSGTSEALDWVLWQFPLTIVLSGYNVFLESAECQGRHKPRHELMCG